MSQSNPNIVVVGSSNTDMVVKTPRIPVKGETILGREFIMVPGGKGANQAVAASRLGAQVTFIARVGNDIFGDSSLSNFIANRINTRYIQRDPETPSGVALIFVDEHGENVIVVAPGSNAKLSPDDVQQAEAIIRTAAVILLQLEIPIATVEYTVSLAQSYNVPVILNPAPATTLSPNLLHEITYLTPNETEASILSGIKVNDTSTAETAGKKLIELGVETVIVTLGAAGALVVTAETTKLIPAPKVTAVDTTAAGDAFNGGLAVALATGKSLLEAVQFANYVGALSVTKMGAQPSMPTYDDVMRFMANSNT
ncbi:MAG: ribokinase [bacterium]|nr:ribokinase [bacterium]